MGDKQSPTAVNRDAAATAEEKEATTATVERLWIRLNTGEDTVSAKIQEFNDSGKAMLQT